MDCPCGSARPFDDCCGPYLARDREPPTAEALMRARYSAYARGEIDFVLDTHLPAKGEETDREETEKWSRESEWLGLEIVSTTQGGEADEVGTVEFVARYREKEATKETRHHERSLFRRIEGKWRYVEGAGIRKPIVREQPKVGRNEPCPCGSGKKYKRCHGAAA